MTDSTTPTPQVRTKKGLIKAFIIVGLFLIVLFGGLFGFHAFVNSKIGTIMSTWKVQPAVITAATAKAETWNPYLESVGNAVAIESINVSAQASGLVSAIYFKSGETVQKGQKLFELDSTMLQAQLKQNQANEALKRITYKRDEKLLKSKAISQQTLDIARANYAAAEAQTEATQAQINYTIVKAPFAGKIGIRSISVGDFFQQGNAAATLDTISPIFVDFTISGNNLSEVHTGQLIKVFSETYPGKEFEGKVIALDSRISENSRALNVRAELQNKEKKIFPGMFLTTHLMLPTKNKVISVPQTAINYTLYGDTVYVLKPVLDKDGKQEMASYNVQSDPGKLIHTKDKLYTAELASVDIGTLNGKKAAITKGVESGDLVVSSGQLKIKGGQKVTINNQYIPKVK